MGFLDSLAILLFLPIMAIFTEVSDNFTIIQNNSTTWFKRKLQRFGVADQFSDRNMVEHKDVVII